jgi:type IV pilus assembly protein PilP
MINKKTLLVLFSLLTLSACKQTDLGDIKEKIEKEKSLAVSFLPEALELKSHEKVFYSSSGLKSPFRNTISEVKTSKRTMTDVQPDLNRVKGELEQYPLTNFQMLGTIKASNEKDLQAIVNNGVGKVFIVSVGDYLGKNEGKILKIKEGKIEIEEIIPNGNYRWVKRPATISILSN